MKNHSELEQVVLKNLQARLAVNEKRVQKTLALALNDMRGAMTKIYEKYATKGVLTRAEMTKYNKYATMEKQFLSLLDPALKETIKDIKRLSPEMYNASFFQYAWAMDNGNGVRLSYGNLNPDTINELFSITNPKNIEMINALKNYNDNAKKAIRNALLSGLSQGKSYAAMISDLSAALNVVGWQALRIIRTEGQRAINTAQTDLYTKAKAQGIEGNEIWDATLDGRTRKTHQAADGQKKNDEGYFIIGGYKALYPVDPNLPAEESINCRCHTRFEVSGYSPQLRRTRDQGIIPYQTYSDWEKNYGKPPKVAPVPMKEKDFNPIKSFVPAKTKKEAEQWAKDNLGVRYANYGKLDISIMNQWNEGIYNNITRIPKLMGKIKDIGSTQQMRLEGIANARKYLLDGRDPATLSPVRLKAIDKIARAYYKPNKKAWALSYGGTNAYQLQGIGFSELYGANKALPSLYEGLEYCVKVKFHPVGCDTVKSVLDHEVGHQIDNLLGRISESKEFASLLESLNVHTLAGATENLSSYPFASGRMKSAELLAEAWAEYNNNPSPRPAAKAIGEFLLKKVKEL